MQAQTFFNAFRTLAIDQLRESPTNPRRSFDQVKLQELAESIRVQGVLVPLIVRELGPEDFEVVAGARRFRAAQMAEQFSVPVRVVELTDSEALVLQLIENAQRDDVHPYEEAMAYKALLQNSEPKYDVISIAAKTGKSLSHIHGRLRMADLIPEAAKAFQANQITAGHALLIARLPETQQAEALAAAFRQDYQTKQKHAIPVRELAQWIRDTLMLTLSEAVFDREDADLVPAAGPCTSCLKRTGANTVLFEDFAEDDRCLDADCFKSNVDAHIDRQKRENAELIQITRAYYAANKESEVLTRNDYTVIEPSAPNRCPRATAAVVVEGPGKRGEIVTVCADPSCPVHGKADEQAEREEAIQQRQEEWRKAQEVREQQRAQNRELLDSVLSRKPAELSREDFQMIAMWMLERLDGEEIELAAERNGINVDGVDAPELELSSKIKDAGDEDLRKLLVLFALCPSALSDEPLAETDALAIANRRYGSRPMKTKRSNSQRLKVIAKSKRRVS